MLRQMRSTFANSLHEFAASPAVFKVFRSIPTSDGAVNVKTLYVLDSSFNPPSKAHSLIANAAITGDGGSDPKRLLLLLATENADKKPKPADFEDRLVMMTQMAEGIRQSLGSGAPAIDVGVTKKPFFMDKAQSIDDSGFYGDAQQVHLIGYDTVIRIFDSKYYPPDQKLKVLEPFLSKHRLRVCYRIGGKFTGHQQQDRYLEAIGDGSREDEGMKREWRQMIDLVDDAKKGEGISSTEARNAAAESEWEALRKYVGVEVCGYIQQEKLYNKG